jgi:hypothetical protein
MPIANVEGEQPDNRASYELLRSFGQSVGGFRRRPGVYLPLAFGLAACAGMLLGMARSTGSSPGSGPAVAAGTSSPMSRLPARAPGKFLAVAGDAPKLQLIPGQVGYQPNLLAEFVGFKELFLQEPRNEAWAGPLEVALPGILQNDTERILPGFRITSAKCRTTLCKITWDVRPDLLERSKEIMMYIAPASGGVVKREPLEYYFALTGSVEWLRDVPPGDPVKTLAGVKMGRERLLGFIRKGKGRYRLPKDIPVEAWPME